MWLKSKFYDNPYAEKYVMRDPNKIQIKWRQFTKSLWMLLIKKGTKIRIVIRGWEPDNKPDWAIKVCNM